MDLEGVTDELYGAPPDQFTARRDELARQAGAEGDKALAAAVRALRRPTAAAWVVNHLVREDSDAVEALVGLGERMREAQSTLSGAQMRALSRERQSMLRELVRHATALAGGSVSASVTVEVEQTLRAVLADEDASAAVRSGCLTHGLAYSGLGPAGAGASGRHLRAVPGPAGRPSSQGAGAGTRAGSGDDRDDAVTPPERAASERAVREREVMEREVREREVSEREAAERRGRRRELAEAESALRSSERAAEAATARAERARRRQQEAEEDVAERERAWQAARERAAAARSAAGTAADQAAAAQSVAAAARQEVERIRPALGGS
jgi:hypothetical protein